MVILDTIESVLKKEVLDNQQKLKIENSLSKCKYSKLIYNKKFELKPLETTNKLSKSTLEKCPIKEVSKEKDKSFISDTDSSISPQLERTSQQFKENVFNLNQENEKEIDAIIESEQSEKILSPSSFYLKFQGLSVEEKKYIESQDKARLLKNKDVIQKAKNKYAEPNSFFKNLNDFKESQQMLKEPFFKIKKPEKIPKVSIESTKSMAKDTNLNNNLLPSIQDEIDSKKLQQLEAKLSDMVNRVKIIKQKYESPEFKEVFDTSFHEYLKKTIESCELFGSKKQIEETGVKQMEENVLIVTKEFEQKITNVQDRVKAKEEERVLKEQLKKKFQTDLKSHEEKYNELSKSLMDLIPNLKIDRIQLLKNQSDLLKQAKYLFDEIEINIKEIGSILEENINKKFDVENGFNSIISELDTNLEKYKKNKDSLESKMNYFNNLIKQSEDAQLKEAQKQKELEENELKLKEAQKAIELKQREKEIEQETAARKILEEKANQRKQLIQNINETDKNGINPETFKKYDQLIKQVDNMRKEVETSLSNPSFKLYKFDLQKAINFPLNSLLEDDTNEENRRNFNEKIKTLLRLLSGQTCDITTTLTVAPSKHPKSIQFCLIYLAKKLIEKGEETVATRPETAFQYVQVIGQVLKQVKEFESVLFAHFFEKCPFTVPYYKQRIAGQTDEQYYEHMGYKVTNGKIEDDVHYYKRMSGVLHLYFTFLMHMNTINLGINGYKQAWNWIADVLNMTPRPEITAEMLTVFFKCCGFYLKNIYGSQFLKVVKICSEDFMQLIKSIPIEKQSAASVGRLQAVFDQFYATRQFQEWKK